MVEQADDKKVLTLSEAAANYAVASEALDALLKRRANLMEQVAALDTDIDGTRASVETHHAALTDVMSASRGPGGGAGG